MKFNGTTWMNVGLPGFSAGSVEFTSLAFSPTGEPYVAYLDYLNDHKATVMRYDSVLTGINAQDVSKLSVYPDPATNNITIETSGKTKESMLAIVNVAGQELFTSQITLPRTQLDITSLPAGVYFLRLTSEKTVEVCKIIKW
jgi:hypothetical protein